MKKLAIVLLVSATSSFVFAKDITFKKCPDIFVKDFKHIQSYSFLSEKNVSNAHPGNELYQELRDRGFAPQKFQKDQDLKDGQLIVMGITNCYDNEYDNVCTGFARVYEYRENMEKFILIAKGSDRVVTISDQFTLGMDNSSENILCTKTE